MIPSSTGTHSHPAPRTGVAASSGWLRGALRWWPVAAGLALGVGVILRVQPASEITVLPLPVLALIYLIFGAARRTLRRPGVLRLQTAGLLGLSAIAILALFMNPAVGHYVVAAGFIGHAMWDLAHHRDLTHHRSTGVVPRWYAEVCFVFDLLVAAALLVV